MTQHHEKMGWNRTDLGAIPNDASAIRQSDEL